jgi:PAS domain S-box-containing protein
LEESPFGPFSITHARRLAEALGHLQGQRFDAVLLDLGLPDSQGLKTLETIRNVKPREVSVVVVTEMGDEALRIKALQEGADDYLIKGASTDGARARSVRYAIERKRANETVLAFEQRLDLAVDAARIGIFDWNVQTGRITWSHHHAELFGLGPDQFSGTCEDFQRCVHPDDLTETIERIQQSFADGEEYHHDFRVVWPDGSEHWIAGRGRVFNDRQGRPLHLLGTIVDITQRKAAEESARVREAEMARLSRISTMGQMASGIAHELGQPLGAIANYATACHMYLQSHKDLPGGALKAIEGVLNAAHRAGAIVSNMRSFVRKQQPVSIPLDINELVRESVGMMEFELREQGIHPRLLLTAGLPMVLGDAVQIEQVLVNLLLNAVQAIGESTSRCKRLTVNTALQDEGRSVEVCVIDTGAGIRPEKMGRLFEPFYTTKAKGLGMGLNICRAIIESEGGRLSAALNPGRGMRFSFTVPVAESAIGCQPGASR